MARFPEFLGLESNQEIETYTFVQPEQFAYIVGNALVDIIELPVDPRTLPEDHVMDDGKEMLNKRFTTTDGPTMSENVTKMILGIVSDDPKFLCVVPFYTEMGKDLSKEMHLWMETNYDSLACYDKILYAMYFAIAPQSRKDGDYYNIIGELSGIMRAFNIKQLLPFFHTNQGNGGGSKCKRRTIGGI